MAKSPSRRRIFDLAITLACYRWELLRRNPNYQRDVQRWIDRGYTVFTTGVIHIPFDLTVNRPYQADCAKWGLRLLLHPNVVISEEDMAGFPVFVDTPPRQRKVKDEAAWERWVQRLPIDGVIVRVGNRKIRRVSHVKDLHDRDLRRYFRIEEVPKGPFQLPSKRKHLRKFDWYLTVFDQHKAGRKFDTIAKALSISVHQAKRAFRIARRLIQWSDKLKGSDEAIQDHFKGCPECRSRSKASTRDWSHGGWCPKMERLIERQTGISVHRWLRESTKPERELATLAARKKGELPARSKRGPRPKDQDEDDID